MINKLHMYSCKVHCIKKKIVTRAFFVKFFPTDVDCSYLFVNEILNCPLHIYLYNIIKLTYLTIYNASYSCCNPYLKNRVPEKEICN